MPPFKWTKRPGQRRTGVGKVEAVPAQTPAGTTPPPPPTVPTLINPPINPPIKKVSKLALRKPKPSPTLPSIKPVKQSTPVSSPPVLAPIDLGDPVTAYANDVVSGKVFASRLVIAACKRHLSDLKRTDIYWDLDAALHRIYFNSDELFLPYKEEPFLRPFVLLPWQMFVEGSLFGWKMVDPDTGKIGYRRFQYAYIEGAKGCGKSPEAASTMIYLGICDGEPQAECYFAAADKDQAMVAFRSAVDLCRNSPELEQRISFSGRKPVWQITYINACSEGEDRLLGSFLKPISSDNTQSGPRPHGVLFDELHEVAKEEVVNMMRKAIGKNRTQPLLYEITNSGVSRESICYQHRIQAERMLDGTMPNDRLFAFIAGLDVATGSGDDALPGDIPDGVDPLKYLLDHRELWVKANPGIDYGVPGYQYVEQQIKDALSIPSQKNLVLRLHFCIWTDAHSVWIGDDAWMACGYELGSRKIEIGDHGLLTQIEADMLGRRCYGGLDLARSNDWSSMVLLFPDDQSNKNPDSQTYTVIEYFWIDEATFNERAAKNPILYTWRENGDVIVTPGEVFDPTPIRDFILDKLSRRYLIQAIGYDRTFAHQIITTLTNDGFNMLDFAQTHYRMGAPVAEIERRVRARLLRHGKNPIMRWMMRNVQLLMDIGGLGLIDKKRSSEKVDGPVAMANAMGIMMTLNKGDESGGSDHYAERGVIVIEDAYY